MLLIDPTCMLLPPCNHNPIPPQLAEKVIASLSTQFDLLVKKIHAHLWKVTLKQYGKVQHLDGGDTMNASKLVPVRDDLQDCLCKFYIPFPVIFLSNCLSMKC